MQAAPAVAFDADDGGLWRAAVAALTGLAAATVARWAVLWASALDVPAAGWLAMDLIVAGAGGLAAAVWAWRRASPSPARLAWHANEWRWQAEGRPAQAGGVRVAADLGVWMLLRFDPLPQPRAALAPRRWARGRRWIPIAAPGGAVRAALYAAVPAGGRAGPRRGP